MRSQAKNGNGNSPSSTGTSKPGLARAVTKDNLIAKAGAFTSFHDDEWVTVGKPCSLTNGEDRTREFGAWMAYFNHLGMSTGWFEKRETITVPARWPHMFDAEYEVQTDYAAAGVWVARLEMERRLEAETKELTPEQRAKVIRGLKAKWWPSGKPPIEPVARVRRQSPQPTPETPPNGTPLHNFEGVPDV